MTIELLTASHCGAKGKSAIASVQ